MRGLIILISILNLNIFNLIQTSAAEPSTKEIRNLVKNFKQNRTSDIGPLGLEVGTTDYVDNQHIRPGQDQYAALRALQKIDRAQTVIQSYGGIPYDSGRSLVPLKDACDAILTPYGVLLLDGHHSFIANLYFGGSKFPVKIVDDLSKLSLKEFWKIAKKKNYVHLNSKKKIRMFSAMRDNPNRFLVAAIARRLSKKPNAELKSTGADYPVWIKIERRIHFVELILADSLRRLGVRYKNKEGLEPSAAWVEKARRALVKALEKPKKYRIPKLTIIRKRTHHSELDMNDIYENAPNSDHAPCSEKLPALEN